jgi:hypothetical protein
MKKIWLWLLLSFISSFLKAEKNPKTDSLQISNTIYSFFDWYIDAIKENKFLEFQPKFIENDSGMTTLDYSIYIDNLKKHRFSDSLLLGEINSYQVCIDTLAKIRYSDFQKNNIYRFR